MQCGEEKWEEIMAQAKVVFITVEYVEMVERGRTVINVINECIADAVES